MNREDYNRIRREIREQVEKEGAEEALFEIMSMIVGIMFDHRADKLREKEVRANVGSK